MHRRWRGHRARARTLLIAALLPAPAELALFAGATFVLNATPGVDLLLTVSRTLAGGARAGLAAALGISAGCAVHALAAAAGLAALLALHPAAFQLLQWAGAAYLAWLGLGMLRRAWQGGPGGQPAEAAGQRPAHAAHWADFRAGLFTNVLNPKVALFFVAFLPPFVPATSPHKTASLLLLGLWFVVQSALFLSVLVAMAAALSRWQTPARVRRVWGGLGGLMFLLLAVRLALGGKPTAG